MQDDNDALAGLAPDAYTEAVQGQQRQALLNALAGSTQAGANANDNAGWQDPGFVPQRATVGDPGASATEIPDMVNQGSNDSGLQPVANYVGGGGGGGGGGGNAGASTTSCQSEQSGKAAKAYMARLAAMPYSAAMHAAGVDVLQKAQADAANVAGDRAMLDDIDQLAHNKGLDDPHGMLTTGVKALAAKYGVNLSGTQSNADVMRQLLGGMASSNLAHGDSTIAGVLSNSLSAKTLDSGAVASLLPVLRNQLDLKEARANVATNYSLSHGNNLSGLPALMSNFNQVADPATVSFGRRMAQVNGTPQHDQMLSNLVQKHPQDWCNYTNRVRAMDEMGAFTHGGY